MFQLVLPAPTTTTHYYYPLPTSHTTLIHHFLCLFQLIQRPHSPPRRQFPGVHIIMSLSIPHSRRVPLSSPSLSSFLFGSLFSSRPFIHSFIHSFLSFLLACLLCDSQSLSILYSSSYIHTYVPYLYLHPFHKKTPEPCVHRLLASCFRALPLPLWPFMVLLFTGIAITIRPPFSGILIPSTIVLLSPGLVIQCQLLQSSILR